MSVMKAIQIRSFGGPEVLRYEDVPRPELKAGEALVRVHAAGVIATDWQFRAGLMPGFLGLRLPVVPGWDIAGVVEVTASGADGVGVGDAVYAMLPGHGGYAEFATVPAAILAPKPHNLSFIEAAAVPLAAMTAYKSLYETAELRPGQVVLIHGAAGGVGSFAIQLAKAAGATVIAATAASHAAFVRNLGADQVIDYAAGPFEEQARDVDVVLDVLGRDVTGRSLTALKDGGLLVTVAGEVPGEPLLHSRKLRAAFVGTEPDGAALRAITKLIESGQIKPFVHEVVPLAEAARAHQDLEAGRARGKIVLQVETRAM